MDALSISWNQRSAEAMSPFLAAELMRMLKVTSSGSTPALTPFSNQYSANSQLPPLASSFAAAAAAAALSLAAWYFKDGYQLRMISFKANTLGLSPASAFRSNHFSARAFLPARAAAVIKASKATGLRSPVDFRACSSHFSALSRFPLLAATSATRHQVLAGGSKPILRPWRSQHSAADASLLNAAFSTKYWYVPKSSFIGADSNSTSQPGWSTFADSLICGPS
mmetsp:Transcript_133671/g.333595  ORF Transcript_133671/g.333595 Transcript_133671/m.333595 type:complete len:224 (+) Transcript_133671:764-1435(+)